MNVMREVIKRKKQFQSTVLDWARHNLRDFPWRKKRTPYSILVAEVILRRTTSKAALRVYEEFLKRWPNIKELSKADNQMLEELLKKIGYHKRRAKILVDIARFVEEEYSGKIPKNKEDLMRIPHVGHYITGAILSLGYDVPAPMVDSNVQRILSRVFRDHLPEKGLSRVLYKIAEALVPNEGHVLFNLGLIDLGALVCRYDRTICSACPLSNVCDTSESSGKILK